FVESPLNDDDNVEPVAGTGDKGKGVATEIPLHTRKAHRRSKKQKIHVHLKPVIERLKAQGQILCSVQYDISSIFISQSTGVEEMAMVKAVLRGMRNELVSMKQMISNLSDLVRVQISTPAPPAPTSAVPENSSGPSGPVAEEAVRPSGPVGVEESGPSGPKVAEESIQSELAQESGPPGPVGDESGPSRPVESQAEQERAEKTVEKVVPPKPPSSPLQTPAPPSPPSSSTAPPAPATFKQPLPKNISSPTPFPTTSSSSPASSTFIPPPTSEAPPAPSSTGASSSSPSSAGPSIPPPSTSYSFLHPPTPPSFVTIIPEGAQLQVDQFLQHASFGTSSSYKMSLGSDEYANFLEAQRQLHIQRMHITYYVLLCFVITKMGEIDGQSIPI
ncbi:hypothetical protein Taro_039541, partial [Colocasia esculenta]|nr:hypothetical protein [Colocasia esculenta]